MNSKIYSKLEMRIIEPASQKQDEHPMTSDRMGLLNLPASIKIAGGLCLTREKLLGTVTVGCGRSGWKPVEREERGREHFSPLCVSPTGSPAAQVLSVLAPYFVQPHTDAGCCLCASSVGGQLLPERSLASWLAVRKNKIWKSLLESEKGKKEGNKGQWK